MTTVANYLKNITPAQKAEFDRIRKIVRSLIPDAEEVISYGIPTFKYKGKYVLYFGAFKNHMSVFPGAAIVLSSRLEGYRTSKGTIQFREEKPLPETIIKEMLETRMAAIDASN